MMFPEMMSPERMHPEMMHPEMMHPEMMHPNMLFLAISANCFKWGVMAKGVSDFMVSKRHNLLLTIDY